MGSNKNPIWRVVVADRRAPRDGRTIETIGHYNPQTDPSTIEIDIDRARHWLGHGAKPTPGQLLAFCALTGIPPGECAMIGDSTHDLDSGRAAGMAAVGVLTGLASRAELAPHADVVLDDVGALPAWLGLPEDRPPGT